MFSVRQNVPQTVYSNLIKTFGAIYDSYIPRKEDQNRDQFKFDFEDLSTVRGMT